MKSIVLTVCALLFICAAEAQIIRRIIPNNRQVPPQQFLQQQYNTIVSQQNAAAAQAQYQLEMYRQQYNQPRRYQVQAPTWGDVYNVAVDPYGYVIGSIANEAIKQNRRNRGYEVFDYPAGYAVPGFVPGNQRINAILGGMEIFWNSFTPTQRAY